MPMLLPSDVVEAAGVRMEAQVPQPGMVLVDKDPRRPLLWYRPCLADPRRRRVQLWYQRVNKGEADYIDQRTLCLGEIRGERWTLAVDPPANRRPGAGPTTSS